MHDIIYESMLSTYETPRPIQQPKLGLFGCCMSWHVGAFSESQLPERCTALLICHALCAVYLHTYVNTHGRQDVQTDAYISAFIQL